ncbi:MAG: hypothetical protein AAFN81_13310 [Bacteroidota bacterium]
MKYFISFCLSFGLLLSVSTTVNAQTTATAVANAEVSTTVKSLTVKVTGVGCNTDVRTIRTEVAKLDGVSACEAAKRGAVTRFVVQFDSAVVCEEDIYQAVEAIPGCKNPNDRPYRVKL